MVESIGLRSRSSGLNRVMTSTNTVVSNDSHTVDISRDATASLTLPNLLKAFPQEHGIVEKLHCPTLYTLLPRCIRRLLCRIPAFRRRLVPKWRVRYLILVGSYLYKFDALAMNNASAAEPPKGSPIKVSSMSNVRIVDSDSIFLDSDIRASGFNPIDSVEGDKRTYFAIDKVSYFAVPRRAVASTWVQSLQTARHESITREMGHAPPDSFPQIWNYYDSLGRQLSQSKERVKARISSSNMRAMEMSTLMTAGGGGASLPRAYYE
jgi:hypothetical protein